MSDYLDDLLRTVGQDPGLHEETQSILNELVEVAVARSTEGANAASLAAAFGLAAVMLEGRDEGGKTFWDLCRARGGCVSPTN